MTPDLQSATPSTLQRYLGEQVSAAELALLCAFGPDLAADRSAWQLRRALAAAGFPGSVSGHLIRVSPLLERRSRTTYRLRPFQP